MASNLVVMSNMGVNNIAPQYTLDVTGNINYTGNLLSNGNISLYSQTSSITVYPDSNVVYGTSTVNSYIVFGSVFNSNASYFDYNASTAAGENSNNYITLKLPGTYKVTATLHSADVSSVGYCVNSSSNDTNDMTGYDPATNSDGIVAWTKVTTGSRSVHINDIYATPRSNDVLRFVQWNNVSSSYTDWITDPRSGISKINIQFIGR
jgi:hypothetical protein